MTHRSTFSLGICALAATFLYSLPATAAPPNVLFIAVDDLRPELHCYGATHMVTPNIDKLASQGRLFRNHYASVPTCGASRYALMTGLRPTHLTDDNEPFKKYMPSSEPATPESWVDLLRRNGWYTVSLGKLTHEPDGYEWNGGYTIGRSSASRPDMRFSWNEIVFDHNKWGAQRYPLFAYSNGMGRVKNQTPAYEVGIDENGNSLPDDAYPDGLMAQAAIEKLREFKDDGTRFCLAVGFYKPHLPFNAPKKYWDLYDPNDPTSVPGPSPASKPTGANSATTTNSGEISSYSNPSKSDRDKLRHGYFACVSYVDAQIGKVLDELDALGLADDTIVVLWGDHGWCLDDYGLIGKHKVLERSLECPLIIRPPANLRSETFASVPAEGIVSSVDIYPTIAEMCGVTPPAAPVGVSLVPMIRNPFAPGKEYAYSRFGSLTALRTLDWRLIKTGSDLDLYDLSSFRYEVNDVSTSNSSVVNDLNSKIGTQASRLGNSTYSTWRNGNPLLADPSGDADKDGFSNEIEYGAGTDALSATSQPNQSISIEDLSSLGFGTQEAVYSYTASTSPDDLTLHPSTSLDLLNWEFAPLEFLDAEDLGNGTTRIRFRLPNDSQPRHFFRYGTSSN